MDMMRSWNNALALLAFIAAAPAAGCSNRESPEAVPTLSPPRSAPATGQSAAKPQRYAKPARKSSEPQAQATPLKAPVPKVVLTEAHEALCNVRVGDHLPEIQLQDLEGHDQDLASLYGPRLTVVCFWRGDRALAQDELRDLGPDVALAYSGRGVQVVGIAVEETAASARQYLSETGAAFPNLVDADGSAFAKVGSEKLPRTYLIDAEGTILWFDIEYSRTTRRDLQQAIRAALGEEASD
jgi:peroxiredoxin